jgi:signal transduction histidine kinase
MLIERATRQKKLEEQLQQSEKMASIGQMVATIAHEIRNPLGIIRSSGEVLANKENPDPARIRKLAGIIVEEATRLSLILTDFLDFARPRSPAANRLDVREVLSKVKSHLEHEIQSRDIKWFDYYTDGEDPIISGDSDLLYQAFLNITMNAFEAMPEGGTFKVTVSVQNSYVVVDFEDSGHGISESDISRIFSPFFTTHEMGTGLGLSVVHNIVSSHNGEVNVRSEEGKWSVFSVSLPVSLN